MTKVANVEEIHQRNKLMNIIFMVTVLLGMLVCAVENDFESVAILGASLVVIGSVISVMIWKRWLTGYVMYVIPFGFGIVDYFLMRNSDVFATFTIIYFTLALVTLYHNYRPIILAGVISLVLTNYFCLTKASYAAQKLSTINMVLLMVIVSLIFSCRIGERLRRNAVSKEAEALQAKEHVDKLLVQIKAAIVSLGGVHKVLKVNVGNTAKISSEIQVAFQEVSTGIEAQAVNVNDISDSMTKIDDSMRTVTDNTLEIKELSKAMDTAVKMGNTQVRDMLTEMQQLGQIVHTTADLMEQLKQRNQKIGDIVAAIHDISTQTNLLSLNAAIEAARAGEHGRGFAVVSGEVRKLAAHSQSATESISTLLQDIQTMVGAVAEQVQAGQQAVINGRDKVYTVVSVFETTSDSTGQLTSRVDGIEQMTLSLKDSSEHMVEDLSSVAGITQQAAASVEEVLASVEEQHAGIKAITSAFEQVDAVAKELERLIEHSDTPDEADK